MANARSNKRDVERARLEKAAAKRERRRARAQIDAPTPSETNAEGGSQEEVLAALAVLHERFALGGLTFADFEAHKDDLVRRLHVQ
jgi:hypothetical protein